MSADFARILNATNTTYFCTSRLEAGRNFCFSAASSLIVVGVNALSKFLLIMAEEEKPLWVSEMHTSFIR